jgi:hypothetical protein
VALYQGMALGKRTAGAAQSLASENLFRHALTALPAPRASIASRAGYHGAGRRNPFGKPVAPKAVVAEHSGATPKMGSFRRLKVADSKMETTENWLCLVKHRSRRVRPSEDRKTGRRPRLLIGFALQHPSC